MDAFSFKLVLEPALENVDQLKFNVVVMLLTLFFSERGRHADHMSGSESAGRRGNAKIPIGRITAQAPAFEIRFIQMTDDKALRWQARGF
jgi:hypothetical protein